MKKYRPFTSGFIVIYVLGVLCIGDALITLINQLRGTINEYTSSFALFSYLIAVLAVLYIKMYASTRIEINNESMRIVCPFYIRPKEGTKRAMFIYRQGDTDIKLINKRFMLADLEKYGFIEDLGYNRLDASAVTATSPLFPVQEVALVMKDGKRYHMNAGFYTGEQMKQMVDQIQSITGIAPTGGLADPVAAKAKLKEEKKKKKNSKKR